MATSYTFGGWIYLLLAAALVVGIVRVVQGRKLTTQRRRAGLMHAPRPGDLQLN